MHSTASPRPASTGSAGSGRSGPATSLRAEAEVIEITPSRQRRAARSREHHWELFNQNAELVMTLRAMGCSAARPWRVAMAGFESNWIRWQSKRHSRESGKSQTAAVPLPWVPAPELLSKGAGKTIVGMLKHSEEPLGLLLEHIIGLLATWIIATISVDGLCRHRAADGDRIRLHPAAVRDHHAVRGLSRLDRAVRSVAGGDGGRDRLQYRLDHRLCGRLLWRAAAGRALGRLCPGRPARARAGDWFFARFGSITVFVGRLLPVVRTFIALPAGIARMPQVKFQLYTFLGSWLWCYALAYVGVKLGERWDSDPTLKEIFHRFDARDRRRHPRRRRAVCVAACEASQRGRRVGRSPWHRRAFARLVVPRRQRRLIGDALFSSMSAGSRPASCASTSAGPITRRSPWRAALRPRRARGIGRLAGASGSSSVFIASTASPSIMSASSSIGSPAPPPAPATGGAAPTLEELQTRSRRSSRCAAMCRNGRSSASRSPGCNLIASLALAAARSPRGARAARRAAGRPCSACPAIRRPTR